MLLFTLAILLAVATGILGYNVARYREINRVSVFSTRLRGILKPIDTELESLEPDDFKLITAEVLVELVTYLNLVQEGNNYAHIKTNS